MTDRVDDESVASGDNARSSADRAALDEYVAARVTADTAARLHAATTRHDRLRADPSASTADVDAAWAAVQSSAREHADALEAESRATMVSTLARMAARQHPSVSRPGPEGLVVETAVQDGDTTVAVTGDVDMATADSFHAAVRGLLDDVTVRRVRLDLGGVKFLDSSGLRALVRLRTAAGPLHTELVLTGVQARVRATLAFAHLDELVLDD